MNAQNAAKYPKTMQQDILILARKYESNGDIGAIGFDAAGGWSYGEFQLSSKQGTVAEFLSYLQKPYNYLYSYLTFAGGNAGAVNGGVKFKAAWKQLATVHRDVFAAAQEEFVIEQYYTPAAYALSRIGFQIIPRSVALSNVLLSLSVMAGVGMATAEGRGACGVFFDAITALGGALKIRVLPDSTLIRQVYSTKIARLDSGKEYASSSEAIRQAVRHRLLNEEADALQILEQENPEPVKIEAV